MLNTIRPLIGQSKTREALEVLTEFLRHRDKELFNECYTQLGRYNHVSQERRRDLIDFDEYTRQVNRINFALVEMLQQAERDFKTPDAPIVPSNTVSSHVSTFEYTVFLSFSSQEKEAAFAVFERLTKADIKTFFSGESLKVHSGQAFSEVIADALENSQHFILFCSPKAMQSTWVKIEWESFFNECHAKDTQNRRFFILKCEDFEQVRVPFILKRLQYAEKVDDIIHILNAENQRLIAAENKKRAEEEATINAETERQERERLAILQKEKAETERLESERIERERLAILQKEKAERERLETENKERERLALLAQQKAETERLETERKERERLALLAQQKAETEHKERERLALLAQQKAETEHKERERLEILVQQKAEIERLENERKEHEQLAILEEQKVEIERRKTERKEREALAILKKEEARKKREAEEAEDLKKKREAIAFFDKEDIEPSFLKRNRMAIGSTGAVAAGFLLWQLTKTPNETPLSNPTVSGNTTQPIVAPQPKVEPNNPPNQGSATIDPKKLPPNVTVGKPTEKKVEKTTPSVSDAQNAANTRREQEEARQKAEKAEAEKKRRDILEQAQQQENEQAQRQMKAKEIAKDILQSALASMQATEYGDAKTYLSQAAAVPNLPEGMKKVIVEARTYITAGENEDAKAAIQQAKGM